MLLGPRPDYTGQAQQFRTDRKTALGGGRIVDVKSHAIVLHDEGGGRKVGAGAVEFLDDMGVSSNVGNSGTDPKDQGKG